MERDYKVPSCKILDGFSQCPVLAFSPGNWDNSIQGTGSNWGGEDIDESDFGL